MYCNSCSWTLTSDFKRKNASAGPNSCHILASGYWFSKSVCCCSRIKPVDAGYIPSNWIFSRIAESASTEGKTALVEPCQAQHNVWVQPVSWNVGTYTCRTPQRILLLTVFFQCNNNTPISLLNRFNKTTTPRPSSPPSIALRYNVIFTPMRKNG